MSNSGPNETLYKILRTTLHVVGFLQFSYSAYYDWFHVNIPITVHPIGTPFAGKLKFLTFWNELLQAFYFGICILNDIFGSNEANPKVKPLIRKFRDNLLCSIAFPVAMFVGITFWCLMAIDRELVLPKAVEPFFPMWLNHMVHTNVMIFTILEMITSCRMYPSKAKGLAGLAMFMGIYLVWVHIIHNITGHWVYPVLTVFNTWQRVAFFVMMLFFGACLYLAGEMLNNKVWHKELKQQPGVDGGSGPDPGGHNDASREKCEEMELQHHNTGLCVHLTSP